MEGSFASLKDGTELEQVSELLPSKSRFRLKLQSYLVLVVKLDCEDENEKEIQWLVVPKGKLFNSTPILTLRHIRGYVYSRD